MKARFSAFSTIVIFICLGIVGAVLIPFLTIQLRPTRSAPSLNVNFIWPQASAKVLEQEITSKLEGVINELNGIEHISSNSDKGYGNINVGFKKNVDLDAIRFEVANLVRQTYPKLPDGASYPQISMAGPSENTSPILSYTINADESTYYIDKYAREHILPKIAALNGVARVQLYGASPYEWVITYNAERMLQLQMGTGDLQSAINGYLGERDLGLADITSKKGTASMDVPLSLTYRSSGKVNWMDIPIKEAGNRIIYLRDIANVKFQEKPVTAYYRINGVNTLNMVIYPEQGINTLKVSAQVREEVRQLEKTLDPVYGLTLTQDSSEFLAKELLQIEKRTLFAIGILLLLTILIYRNARYIFILFSSILINLLIAAIFYYALDVELQLYSFAGITISFGIIIDNSIIMIDHIRHHGNKRAFLAILAATLTTMGAVLIIFFLEESQRLNLWDFAYVIAINLAVSLIVSLFFVPALMERLELTRHSKKVSFRLKKLIVRTLRSYRTTLLILKKPYVLGVATVILILCFGLPVHLLPNKIENPADIWGEWYNKTLGSNYFSLNYRPTLEKYLGGSLRLFSQHVFENSYYTEPEQTVLHISGHMPEGGSIEQLNTAIKKMERYLNTFDEIKFFQTSITSYRNSDISIYFKEDSEFSLFPYALKSLLENRAVSVGGLNWSIYGVGRGFSNELTNGNWSDKIDLVGYSYDKLYNYAQDLQTQLTKKSNGRVKNIQITSNKYDDVALNEFYLKLNHELLALKNVSISQLYNTLKNQLHASQIGSVVQNGELQEIKLISDKANDFNVWDLKNTPLDIGGKQFKLDQLASIDKRKTGNSINKYNQQYHLVVKYDFLGSSQLANKFKDNLVKEFTQTLPMGYKIYSRDYNGWNRDDSTQYYYLFIIVIVIFFICSILLESLLQPFAILMMIPVSFIGVFLTFYFFEFNFDQGGYASFILLAGISVNSALYIINDYNNLIRDYPDRDKRKLYFKAFQNKITPIILTTTTTIVGLLPFVWDGQNEVFWFSFAAGSIGGLIFSLIGLLIYLPLFSISNTSTRKHI